MQDPAHNFEQLPATQSSQIAPVPSSVNPGGEHPDAARSLANDTPHRLIKRYSNRKLYDTEASRYITLLEVAQLIVDGAPIRVVDNATREDKTELTFAQIILEQLKSPAPDGTRSRLTEIIRECQRIRNTAHLLTRPTIGRGTESAAPSIAQPGDAPQEDLPWRERFESKLALLPPSQAAGLRAHFQDLSNRLMELQHQLTTETENRETAPRNLE
jgi:polyhydroxyalkanoate synthesis repressor PhaR